jgi:creatinine amidohydrolase
MSSDKTMPCRFWGGMTTQEIQDADTASWIAVLPLAATEQHGPHLPVGTDALILQGYLDAVMARLPDDVPATFFPLQAVGVSTEHENFAGTLSLPAEVAIAAWVSIGEGLVRAGIRKLILANAHGGNVPVMDVVARRLRQRHGLYTVMASFHRFGYPDGLFAPDELRHGIHGGMVETSLMLHLHPSLVRMDKAADFAPHSLSMEQRFTHLRANHPVGFGWMSEDLHPSGAMGNAKAASAEAGRLALGHGAEAFIALLRDVQGWNV